MNPALQRTYGSLNRVLLNPILSVITSHNRNKIVHLAGLRYLLEELDDWPPTNYGDLLMLKDMTGFGAYFSNVPKDSYEILSRGLYGRLPQIPQVVQEKRRNDFPSPSNMATLFINGGRFFSVSM